jgi:hypothetical protein
MGNPHSILPAWLSRLLASKPTIQPRCSCGRFCSTHDAPPDMTAKLISELSAKGMPIPARLRPTSPDGRG